jgi:hypothetical protein
VAPCVENLRSPPPTARVLLNRNRMLVWLFDLVGMKWWVDSGAGGADRADESDSRRGDQGEGKLTSGILELDAVSLLVWSESSNLISVL